MRTVPFMKAVSFAAVAVLLSASLGAQAQAPAAPANCDPVGSIRFVCGQDGPEDLVEVPNTRWLVASAYGQQGGVFLIDTQARSSRKIFPDATAKDRPNTKTYAECPGAPQGEMRARFRTHGLFLQPGQNGLHTLYAVYHGARESVEVFELDVRNQPALTWIGCVVAPPGVGLNSVAALPGGGLVGTNFDPPQPPGSKTPFSSALTEGRNNGELWDWYPGKGWTIVPGSESAGANGVVLSPDGQWYYVAQWGNRSFYRLSRGKTPVDRQQIPLGFRVDNVRWSPNGLLLVAGQGDTAKPGTFTSIIGTIDPKTMTYREVINYAASPPIGAATVAVQVGNDYWTGTFRGDRIAIYPVGGVK